MFTALVNREVYAQTSLITNGNFESGSTGWTFSNTTQIYVSANNYESPTHSVEIDPGVGNNLGAYAIQSFNATATSYLTQVSAYSATASGANYVSLRLLYNDSSYTSIDLTATQSGTSFVECTLTPASNKFANGIEIIVVQSTAGQGNDFVDDVVVTSNQTVPYSGGYPSGTLINALNTTAFANNWQPTLSNWNTVMTAAPADIDMMMTSVQFGLTTVSAVQNTVDNSGSPPAIIYFYSTYAIKMGLTYNSTAIKYALDNLKPLDYGFTVVGAYSTGLPASTGWVNVTGGSPTENEFYMAEGYLLYVYYWANYYSYDQSLWNLATAYNTFDSMVNSSITNGNYGTMLYIGSMDSTYFIENGLSPFYVSNTRYYDEFGETVRNLLLFYSFGETQALNVAVTMWNTYASVDWNPGGAEYNPSKPLNWTSTGGYFQYEPNPSNNEYECEAAFFLQDVYLLQSAYFQATGLTLANTTLVMQDLQTRFISQGWLSYQWMYSGAPSTVDHTVIHAYVETNQHRLANTLGAWEALYAEWSAFPSSDTSILRNMLLGNGSANYLYPAWQYLYSSSLYYAGNQFRAESNVGADSQSTGQAELLTAMQGIVPQTAVLATPLQELYYQSCVNMIDPELFNINFASNQLTVGISAPGSVTFIYGATPFNYTFASPGLYTLQFDSNWTSVTSQSETALPTRNYLLSMTYSNVSANQTDAGKSTTFSSYWSANAASLSGYIFSTNNTGSWVNGTYTSFSATPSWANVTLTLTSSVGQPVGYMWYVNDSVGQWLSTSIQTLTTTGYYISASSDQFSTITPDGLVGVEKGGSQSFSFSVVNGSYSIQSVIINGTYQAPLTSPYSFSNVQGNESIAVSTSAIIYSVDASSDSGCVIIPSGNLIYARGTWANFTFSAYPNYQIYNLAVNGVNLGPLTSYNFMPSGNTTLSLTSIPISKNTNNGGSTIIINPTPAPTAPTETANPNGETQAEASYYNLVFVVGSVLIVFLVALVMFKSKKKRSKVQWDRY